METFKKYIDALHPIPEDAWSKVLDLCSRKTLLKDEYFVREGVYARRIAFLKKGVVRAFYRTTEGKEYNKYFFSESSIIGGYSSLITGEINVINHQALTDCEIIVLDYKKFTTLFDDYSDLERLVRIIAEYNFVEKEQREIELVTLNADERYALLQKRYPLLEQQIPQYHIASFLGVSPTQLSRIRRILSKR